MDVVRVGDVVLVGDTVDLAEALLQALGKLVGGGLQRSAVDGVVDVLFGFPLGTGVVQSLHDLEAELFTGFGGVGLTLHVVDALCQTGIAEGDGGVTAVEEFVDGLAGFQTGDGAILPEDGSDVGRRAEQTLVADAQSSVAEVEALFHELPELLFILAGRAGDVDEVQGDNALVETAIVLMDAFFEVLGVFRVAVTVVGEAVRSQEGAAAHAGVHVALQFESLLLGDVVRHHALRGAAGCELGQVEVLAVFGDIVILQDIDEFRERRGDVSAGLVLDAEDALVEHDLDDESKVVPDLAFRHFVQVHEDRDEGSLAVGGLQGDELILDGLAAALDFLADFLLDEGREFVFRKADAGLSQFLAETGADLLTGDVDERCEMAHGDGLSAVLAGRDLSDDLRSDGAGSGEALRTVDMSAGDAGAVLQHVLEVDEVAVVHVLCEVVRVVEVDDAVSVSHDDVFRKQVLRGVVAAPLTGHVVSLDGEDGRVLVGVLLFDLFIVALDDTGDLLVDVAHLTHFIVFVAVSDVKSRDLRLTGAHEGVFDLVLDLFDGKVAAGIAGIFLDTGDNVGDLLFGQALGEDTLFVVRLDDGGGNLIAVVRYAFPRTLHDTHFDVFRLHVAIEMLVVVHHSSISSINAQQNPRYCADFFVRIPLYRKI